MTKNHILRSTYLEVISYHTWYYCVVARHHTGNFEFELGRRYLSSRSYSVMSGKILRLRSSSGIFFGSHRLIRGPSGSSVGILASSGKLVLEVGVVYAWSGATAFRLSTYEWIYLLGSTYSSNVLTTILGRKRYDRWNFVNRKRQVVICGQDFFELTIRRTLQI